VGRLSQRQLFGWWSFWAFVQMSLVTLPTWLRARGFGFSNYDLGIYSQALARLARAPPNPWLSGRQIHVFNDHFDPVLFLAAPFARIFPAVQVGLVFEGLCALLALVPLAWLAREGKLSLRALWMFGGVMVLHPGVTQALGFPFHPTVWAMAPMAWLLAALVLERWTIALVALVLLLACKEEFPFVGLALSPLVFMRAPRRVAWAFVSISVAWGVFALVLRPRLLGDVMPYASMPFRGLEDGLGAFLSARLTRSSVAAMGDLFVSFVPMLAWLGWERWKKKSQFPLWLFAALVPMLGIRFLSVAWRDHYGAVVVAAALVAFAAVVQNRVVPWVVVISTLVIVVINSESLIRRDVKAISGAQGWAASAGCSDAPRRAAAVRAAVERVRSEPGPLFVSGNLLPWLAEREDVYAFGGPQPDSISPRVVVIERPPCGDTWARSLEERETLYSRWKSASTTLIDDEFVFSGHQGRGEGSGATDTSGTP
jgi:uncharacterized membrane protein